MSSSQRSHEARPKHRIPDQGYRYRLFGITMVSDFVFSTQLADSSSEPDLTFTCGPAPPFSADHRLPPLSQERLDAGFVHLARTKSHDALRFPGLADFYIATDHIFCHLFDSENSKLVEIQILGPVLAFWLERQSVPALHASAVVVAGQAVAFLSSNHGGKTALAAALMQAGCTLLTDDILPIEERVDTFVGRPGLPQMRMWPDEATHFLGGYEDLEIVHPDHSKRRVPVGRGSLGRLCHGSRLLGCLYLPERRPPEATEQAVEIHPVSPRDALIELVRYSFIAQIVEARGWQARRLEFFSRLVQKVPVRRLMYPDGFDRLPSVGARIMDDVTVAPGASSPMK